MTPAQAVQENLIEFFRHFARTRSTGRTAEVDGISVASSGIAFHMFNAAFLSTPVHSGQELERRIGLAADLLGAYDFRWAFWASEDKMDSAAAASATRVFRRHGLVPSLRHPGMVCCRLAPPARPAPELEIRPVVDSASRAAFAHINAIAFRIPFEWCRELYGVEELWNESFSGYIGFAGGNAVSTSATLIAADAIGVYAVATLPGHEHKGFGEAMTRHALTAAQERSGTELSILQATAAGLPLYRRMGYEVVTHFTVYSA
jgi:GNAT superfamily N-acetyltransferase